MTQYLPNPSFKTISKSIKKNIQGFTLVELMVVIAIIAILAVVGLTLFNNVQRSGRDSQRTQELNAIKDALETHYNPQTGLYQPVAGAWFADGATPADPINSSRGGTNFQYSGIPSGSTSVTTFTICANLEAGGSTCVNSQQ